ncbi:UNVERIFIED_CONTAM: hypothetical protein FKN15_003061 [Acipenser sinensis]
MFLSRGSSAVQQNRDADPPCSQPRATASEDNAALGSLHASLMAPGQTTGVVGARHPRATASEDNAALGQLTGKPAGARPDYRGRWCAVSRGHPGRPNPPSPGRRSANCAPPPGGSRPRTAVE